jgi:hypothetical protein
MSYNHHTERAGALQAPCRKIGGVKWEKSSPELAAAFDAALPDDPRVVRRKMFGYPAAFVNGHMFAGTHEHRIVVRLPEPDAAPFEPKPGRPMREYVVVPPAMRADGSALGPWLARALAYAASLPPKG